MSGTLAERVRNRRVHVDSMTLICFLEGHPSYLLPIVRPVFELLDEGSLRGHSSYLTLVEVLVQPLRHGRRDLARRYRDILVGSPNFVLHPVDRGIAEEGAGIRAAYPAIKTPDAIQLATALNATADTFVTNDERLRGFDRLEILILDDFLSP